MKNKSILIVIGIFLILASPFVASLYTGSFQIEVTNTTVTFTPSNTYTCYDPCYTPSNPSGFQCGFQYDNCGFGWNCGTPLQGQSCINGKIVLTPCTPQNCSQLGYNCGTQSDNCGNILNCGSYIQSGYECANGKQIIVPPTLNPPSNINWFGNLLDLIRNFFANFLKNLGLSK